VLQPKSDESSGQLGEVAQALSAAPCHGRRAICGFQRQSRAQRTSRFAFENDIVIVPFESVEQITAISESNPFNCWFLQTLKNIRFDPCLRPLAWKNPGNVCL